LTVAFTTATSGICTVSGTTLTILSAGTCTINANQAGNANYEAATQVAQSFTIAKATQSITFATPSAMTVGGSTQTVSPTAPSSLTVTLTSTTTGICTVSGFVITAVGSGTCSINANQAGNANYEAATQVAQSFTIAKATQSITFATPSAMTVDGTQTRAPTASSSLTVTLTSTTTGICTVSGFVITAVGAGTCSITASQAGNASYEAATQVVRTFTISEAGQTVTFIAPANIVYGETPASLSATSTSGLVVAFAIVGVGTSDICTVSGTTVTVKKIGTCSIVSKQAGNDNYYRATDVLKTFTISKGTPSLSNFADLTKAERNASFNLTAPTVANSLPGTFTYTSATTATATISEATVTLGSVGTTVITATFTPTDTTNYNSATITMTLTVNRNCAGGGTCAVGDLGPGGGYVFYVSASYFTSAGSTCNTTCKYLEVAPGGWHSAYQDDWDFFWMSEPYTQILQNFDPSTQGFDGRETVNWQIGQGFYNTSLMSNSSIAATVRAYGGNSTAGQWFIPSMNELNELCKYAYGQTTGNLKEKCESVSAGVNFKLTARAGIELGGFVNTWYWSSSQTYGGDTMAWAQVLYTNQIQSERLKSAPARVRPIRAFGP
jgi:hypothetical protein